MTTPSPSKFFLKKATIKLHWSNKILIPNRIKKIGTIDSDQQNKIMYLHTLVATEIPLILVGPGHN